MLISLCQVPLLDAFDLFSKMDIWVQTDLNMSRLELIPLGKVLAQLHPAILIKQI